MPSRLYYAKLAVPAAVITLLAAVVAIPPAIDFGATNPFWNGYLGLSGRLGAREVHLPLDRAALDPSRDALILVPRTPLSPEELDAVARFVWEGGVLLLMDDFGHGNQVLERMRAPVSLLGVGVLVDTIFHYRNSRLPVVEDLADDPATAGVGKLVLNYASALVVREGADVLARSSLFSYLDLDLDGLWDPDEPHGPLPVAARFRYGLGVVYVVADPSIAINAMLGLGGNAKFIENVVGGRRVLVDQRHLAMNLHAELRSGLMAFVEAALSPEFRPVTAAIISAAAITILIRAGGRHGPER